MRFHILTISRPAVSRTGSTNQSDQATRSARPPSCVTAKGPLSSIFSLWTRGDSNS